MMTLTGVDPGPPERRRVFVAKEKPTFEGR